MSSKPKKLKPSIEARLHAVRKAKQAELEGCREWLETLRLMLEKEPTDVWAQGMARHYHRRIGKLEKDIKDVEQIAADQS